MEIKELLNEDQAIPTLLGEDNLREQLNVLVSSGQAKEMVGKELTHEEVKKILRRRSLKISQTLGSSIGGKDHRVAVAQSSMGLTTKLLGYGLPIDDVNALQKDLQEDYLIFQELKITCGWCSLKCGKLMALASAALHVAKHIDLEKLVRNKFLGRLQEREIRSYSRRRQVVE